jgi:hypothetical protein
LSSTCGASDSIATPPADEFVGKTARCIVVEIVKKILTSLEVPRPTITTSSLSWSSVVQTPLSAFSIGSTKLDNPCTLTELSSLDHARQTTEKPLCEYDVRFFEHTISKIEIGCTDHLEADIYFHIKEGYEHLWLPNDYEEGQPIRGTKAKTYIMRMWANEVHGISREAKAFRKSLHMTLMWKDHFFEKPAYYGKAEEDRETYDESIALFAGSGEDTSA